MTHWKNSFLFILSVLMSVIFIGAGLLMADSKSTVVIDPSYTLVLMKKQFSYDGGTGFASKTIEATMKVPKLCSLCLASGIESRVYRGPQVSTQTALNYQDPEGRYHNHSVHYETTAYVCEKGHSWFHVEKKGICWCGWSTNISSEPKALETQGDLAQSPILRE